MTQQEEIKPLEWGPKMVREWAKSVSKALTEGLPIDGEQIVFEDKPKGRMPTLKAGAVTAASVLPSVDVDGIYLLRLTRTAGVSAVAWAKYEEVTLQYCTHEEPFVMLEGTFLKLVPPA